MINTGLQKKTILITGANNPDGIGAAIARAFAKEGACIFLHYWRSAGPSGKRERVKENPRSSPGEAFYAAQRTKDATEVLRNLKAIGVEAHAGEVDFLESGGTQKLFDQAEATIGQIDILVNNAAHWEADTFLPADVKLAADHVEKWTARPQSISAESFARLFDVNAKAVALLMGEFAQRHIQRSATWGRIINISTDGAYCFPSEVSYGASKLAMEGLTRSAAVEFGRFGITVNAISPGPIQTGWITPELEQELIPTIPLGRVGQPTDIADVAVFLASEQARWITGQRIHVGGGHAM